MTQDIPISSIDFDRSPLPRASLRQEVIVEYAKAMRAGAQFPPILVVAIGDRYYIADGWHRTKAAIEAGYTQIRAEVVQGDEDELYRLALRANIRHGVRRSPEDKRKAVEIALKRWPQKTDAEIAQLCVVEPAYVLSVRRSLQRRGIISRGPMRKLKPGTDVPTDAVGQPIPPEAYEVWSERYRIIDHIDTLRKLIAVLKEEEKTYPKLYAGVVLKAVVSHLQLAMNELILGVPYAVCPVCGGGVISSACNTCFGRGFVNKQTYGRLADHNPLLPRASGPVSATSYSPGQEPADSLPDRYWENDNLGGDSIPDMPSS